jgi:hypothetical protein
MREDVLRRYFSAEASIGEVAEDLRGSVTHLDSLRSTVGVEDMRGSFPVSRQHVIRLCDAFLGQALNADSLSTIAFVLLASESFEWDDDVTSDVLSDWSAPEINFELNEKTINMQRGWLMGSVEPHPRRMTLPSDATLARLVSVRTKTRC